MKVLVIAPQHDLPTTLSTSAVFEFEKWLLQEKITHSLLHGIAATRWILEGMASQFDLICYFGHGEEFSLIGQHILSAMLGGRGLVDKKNYQRVKPKIVYTMSCLSGIGLGPLFGKNGIGYFGHETWYYGAFAELSHNYAADWSNYITYIPKLLIKGVKPLSALAKQRRLITGYVEEYEKFKYSNYKWHIDTATKNRDFAHFYGPNLPIITDRKWSI